jgi:hypothetical protein
MQCAKCRKLFRRTYNSAISNWSFCLLTSMVISFVSVFRSFINENPVFTGKSGIAESHLITFREFADK